MWGFQATGAQAKARIQIAPVIKQSSTPAPASIAGKITEKFEPKVVAAVASLGDEAILEERDLRMTFIEAHLGRSTLERDRHLAYTIGSDAKVVVHFTLDGEPSLFQEHLSTLLGEGWSGEGTTVAVRLQDSNSDEDIKAEVNQCLNQLDAAILSYHQEVHQAQASLLKLARETYWRRVAIQQAMAKLKIPRKR